MSVSGARMLELLKARDTNVAESVSIEQFPSLLHSVVNFPEILERHLQLIDVDKRLGAVKAQTTKGNSLLHSAASDPQALKLVLDVYPKDELLAALQVKNKLGETVLHLAANNEKSLNLLSAYYSVDELFATAQEKDKYGNSALHNAVSSLPALRKLLSFYPKSEQQKSLFDKNHSGNTVFHKAVPYTDSLVALLEMDSSSDQRDVLNLRNNDTENILVLALYFPETLTAIFAWLSPENQSYAVNAGGKFKYDLLHWAPNPQAIQVILSFFNEQQCFDFITKKDITGATLLEKTIENTPRLNALLQRFPKAQNWQLCNPKNKLKLCCGSATELQQLLSLSVYINQLKEIGLQAPVTQSDGHAELFSLVDSLHTLVEQFVDAKSNLRFDEVKQLQIQFKETIDEAYKNMRTDKELIFAVLANICIAATVVGILAIAGMFLITGTSFFMQTARQQQVSCIDKIFQELTRNNLS